MCVFPQSRHTLIEDLHIKDWKEEILSQHEPKDSRYDYRTTHRWDIFTSPSWFLAIQRESGASRLPLIPKSESVLTTLVSAAPWARTAGLGFYEAYFGRPLSHTLVVSRSAPQDQLFSNDVSLERGIQENHLVSRGVAEAAARI